MLNTVGENRINCAWETEKCEELSWYTWCQACHKNVILKEKIYKLVRERLIRRKNCFQFSHKCTGTNLFVSIESFQKCKDDKDCWKYNCKKCLGVFHVSNVPSDVRKRMEENLIEDEEKNENDSLLG
uniref:Uncharacterized protein n=1 Tax=Marseillevirus LCMAC101 TaxID=2506602 RepID=A0A481YRB4_9VIRU|nr:MAG: hypothetical protein LCMAC101_01740 [Marseillevirus LCMAC101]